ncbi:MAG: DUF4340 domain-containing protein [Hyphomicrobium sp.]|nr:DUF4340 domain-containing protein [Hyphomicrobium sp.]
MKPNEFTALALAATAAFFLAVATYVAATPWASRLSFEPARLLPQLSSRASDVAAIEVRQGKTTAKLEKQDGTWRITSEGGYPADPEKVRALLVAATEADVVEKKTARMERHADLGLADPELAETSARLIRFLDKSGAPVAEIIAGRTTLDAFEASKGGTYVRRPGDNQSYLANREIAASLSLRDWAETKLVDLKPEVIKSIRIEPVGQAPYEIKRAADGKSHELVAMPAGKKLKYVSGVDDIAEAVSLIEFKGVAKAGAADNLPSKGKATFTTDNGFNVVVEFRSDDKDAYVRITPSGEGDSKAAADALTQRTQGFDFEVPLAELRACIVNLADLIEDAPA